LGDSGFDPLTGFTCQGLRLGQPGAAELGKLVDVHARAIEIVDFEARTSKLESANEESKCDAKILGKTHRSFGTDVRPSALLSFLGSSGQCLMSSPENRS
jgi:hypothetical protein